MIAAQSLGSVNVSVHPLKDWFDAIATEFLSSFSVRTWNRSSAPLRSGLMYPSSSMQSRSTRAVVRASLLLVGGFDELVH